MINEDNKKFSELSSEFLNNSFFPHIIIDNFLEEKIAKEVNKELIQLSEDAKPFFSYNCKKYALDDIDKFSEQTKALVNFLNSQKFINELEKLTGLEGVIPDPELAGSGLHFSKKDGYLNIHVDFQSHIRNKTWARVINLLIYFNEGWTEKNNGNLDIWNADFSESASVLPEMNRCVIFRTVKKSYHGHPNPLSPPENDMRKSILISYYVDTKKPLPLEETDFYPAPGDSFIKKKLIKIDQLLLRIFSYIKRLGLVKDSNYTRVINYFLKNKY